MNLLDFLRRPSTERLLRRQRRTLDLAAKLGPEPTFPGLASQVCTAGQVCSPAFLEWAEFLKSSRETLHRKVWEYCYIAQVVREQLGFTEGMRGLGFGVGCDRMADAFAALGCHVIATDQAPERAATQGWTETAQYAKSLAELNRLQLCPPELFHERVSYRTVDMNHIPEDLRDFDFVWSACAFEHLGSIEHGLRFVENAMECLRPGGWAVHTTEFNLVSDNETVSEGATVLFRKRDIEELFARLERRGHCPLPLNLNPGSDPLDRHIDVPPYARSPHLRLLIGQFTATSLGIAVQCAS